MRVKGKCMINELKQSLNNIISGTYGADSTKKDRILSPSSDLVLFLFVFGIFLIYNETWTIMWPENWTRWEVSYLRAILFTCFFIKYALGRQKKWTLLEIFLGIMVAFAFLMNYQMTGDMGMMDIALLLFCAKDIPYEAVLKEYVIIKVPMIVMTIIGSRLGVIENLVYYQGDRVREAFGFIYPTDFAAQIFFLFLVWALIRRVKISYIELVGMAISGVLLKRFCDTNNSMLCIWILILSMIVFKILNKMELKGKFVEIAERVYRSGCLCIPFVFSALMILLSRFYNSENLLLRTIDKALNYRLGLGLEGFIRYDTTLWGQYVEMHGNGGTTEQATDYFFLDDSYVNIWLRKGWVIFALVLLLFVVIILKNWKDDLLLWILVMVCLHSVIEHHFLEFYYNVFIILPLASFSGGKRKESDETVADENLKGA